MATLVLGALGSTVGGALGGPVGAILGKAAGSYLGNIFDHQLFGEDQHREGPRLQNLDVQTSTEGAGIPLTFGRTRTTGQVIWATRFEEVATTTRHRSGGKGGGGQTTVTTEYYYYANFAVGLCEGRVADVSRVWADGKLVDRNAISMRVHRGTEDQQVDPLIASKEGTAPAFRGTCYVVFERLPLEPYGNRIPQLSFEVVRPVGGLEDKIRAVTVIPGSTEFGYDPQAVVRTPSPGVTQAENTHDATAPTDWHASMDQLQALCPNVERVALVVAWFGTSLNAGECIIEPRVDEATKITSKPWSVAGLTRQTANQVSRNDGRPAFGGSPSDASVIGAIRDLKARGLKVTLLPFIMMDVPADNQLTDPWTGADSQSAYPWRGRITVSPAPGQAGSPDASAAAAGHIASFVGSASPGLNEWSFRRFILHLANLSAQAGGVDAFLLGSEMRGLTTSRDAPGSYPFVDALVTLADDVRAILGGSTTLTYGADWSEYSNHAPNDGSGDLTFHLDPLWASANIDVIGIDQYQPLTDWRHDTVHLDQALGTSPYDPAVIRAGLTGGENWDWFYASETDRVEQNRTPITDADYGEPWVWRSKDMASWWSNQHHNRVRGVRQATSTAYVPGSKPIWLTEFGAPAVDLAGNEPAAFPSDKPDNDRLPPFSRGIRDDAQQRAILETCLDVWAATGSAENPLSPIDGRPMIDPSGTHLWTWDARPFPIFPLAREVWSDGVNWVRGHWLTGRLGTVSLASILLDLARHYDLPPIDVSGLSDMIEGYAIPKPVRARSPLEDLGTLFAFDLAPTPHGARALPRATNPTRVIPEESIVDRGEAPLMTFTRGDRESLPRQMTLGFSSNRHDYQPGIMRSARRDGAVGPDEFLSVPITLDPDVGGQMAERIVQEKQVASQTLTLQLPPSFRYLEPGDTAAIAWVDGSPPLSICIDRLVDGSDRKVEAHCIDPSLYGVAANSPAVTSDEIGLQPVARPTFGQPQALVLDLPSGVAGGGADHNVRVAAYANPWPGAVDVFAGHDEADTFFVQAIGVPATMGTLRTGLKAGPTVIPHRGGEFEVELPTGSLSTITEDALMAGGNVAALVTSDGLEVVQFQTAELIEPGVYAVSGLLRGLGGTEHRSLIETPEDASFVILDESVEPLELRTDAISLGGSLTFEPSGGGLGDVSRITLPLEAGPLSLAPLAPVHLRATFPANGDLSLTWMRRARGLSNDWSLPTIPLNEEAERYLVSVMLNGEIVREEETITESWTYAAAEQLSDGVAGASVVFQVAQIGTAGRVGRAAIAINDL
ncbi:MAG: glycoside hydrolase/phage tail family protein [Pseudomonadota bacterium]